MTLASILILCGIVCLAAGVALPIAYAVRLRFAGHRRPAATARRARLVGATGAIGAQR